MDIALQELAAVAEGVKPLLDWRGVPVDLASLAALAAGLGWASGLRLYALVFVLGALARFAGVQLPGGLGVLAHPLVLGVSGLLLLVEFFADKLPWLDSAAATPTIRLAVETIPSFAPNTAARSHPIRCVR